MTSLLKMTVVGPQGIWPRPVLLMVPLDIVPNLFSHAFFVGF